MGFWVELHCESSKQPVDKCGKVACPSRRGDQPGALVHKVSAVPEVLRQLTADAKAKGWQRLGGKWNCPNCLKEMEKEKGERP